ncbi:MAG: radical SAM protein [Lachnospiraceae bacterium]|nr:radical SAM protein [Lachnospiraceae bacterium]MDN4743967.1 radical SAM protein [Lachnospiraceae bacterium C1.1]
MSICNLCPRHCGADRDAADNVSRSAYCGVSRQIKIARADLHYWEEPCISGENGSGAVFFSGCSLKCVFCQNKKISRGAAGKLISEDELADIYFNLQEKGANNINLVTGDHYIPEIVRSIRTAKTRGIKIPFVFNCSGYETVQQIKALDGLIDVYLPDFKYMDRNIALKYSDAADYPEIAKKALEEMVRQCGGQVLDSHGIMTRGVIVRQLLLPGNVLNSRKVIRYLYETYGDRITISIMAQYTPMEGISEKFPELSRKVRKSEYDRLVDFALSLGVTNAFIQDMSTAKESFIPDFYD